MVTPEQRRNELLQVRYSSTSLGRLVVILGIAWNTALTFNMRHFNEPPALVLPNAERGSQEAASLSPAHQGLGAALAASKTTKTKPSSQLSFTPTMTDEMAQTALESLDADHKWMRHVQFLMIGTQKGGSTSLFTYLNGHSKTESKAKECLCFEDYRFISWDPVCERQLRMWWRDDEEDFMVGDYTPGYIYRTEEVLPRIQEHYPWVKILATLREPASRAFSQYNMLCGVWEDAKCEENTFESVVLTNLVTMHKAGLLPHWYFNKPVEELSLEDWLRLPIVVQATFDDFFGSDEMVAAWKLLFELEISAYRHNNVVMQGLYAVGLFRWLSIFPRDRFLILRSTAFKADVVQETMTKVFSFLNLPDEPLVTTDEANVGNKTRSEMDPRVFELLQRVYAPYNEQLERLLGEEWKDPFPV